MHSMTSSLSRSPSLIFHRLMSGLPLAFLAVSLSLSTLNSLDPSMSLLSVS
ncbi:MAG: hypothetical protein RXQ79_06840 [Acidilobus sp.]